MVFRSRPDCFNSKEKNIWYALSFLRKDAFTWYQTLEQAKYEIKSFDEFCDLFLATWGEADEAQNAKDKLKSMKQRGPCSAYVTEFNHYALLTGYDDNAKRELFYDGLKEGVKDLLLTMPDEPDFTKYQAQAVKCDIRPLKRRQDHQCTVAPSAPFVPRPNPPSQQPTPMEIDQIDISSKKKGPLTPSEKKRRVDNNLCLYCGDGDCAGSKNTESCPKLKARNLVKDSRRA